MLMFMHGKEKEHPFKQKQMRKDRPPVSTEDDQLKGSFLTVSGLCYILKRISVQGLAVSLGIWWMLALIGMRHVHTLPLSLFLPKSHSTIINLHIHAHSYFSLGFSRPFLPHSGWINIKLIMCHYRPVSLLTRSEFPHFWISLHLISPIRIWNSFDIHYCTATAEYTFGFYRL